MPTYVYACKNCGHRFEKHQSFSEDALTVCPECSEEALHKVYDTVGISFKGSGFYRTDSRSDSQRSGGKGSSAGGSASKDGSAKDGSSSSSSASTGSDSSSSGASKPGASTSSGSKGTSSGS